MSHVHLERLNSVLVERAPPLERQVDIPDACWPQLAKVDRRSHAQASSSLGPRCCPSSRRKAARSLESSCGSTRNGTRGARRFLIASPRGTGSLRLLRSRRPLNESNSVCKLSTRSPPSMNPGSEHQRFACRAHTRVLHNVSRRSDQRERYQYVTDSLGESNPLHQ